METNRAPLGVLSDTGRPERRRISVLFKESHFFLIRMVFHEERIDTAFSSGKTAAAGPGGVDLILCNAVSYTHLDVYKRQIPY